MDEIANNNADNADKKEAGNRWKSVAAYGASVAFVATLAFGAGIAVANSNPISSIISSIPFLGDGLDATPNQEADLTDFWKAWNALEKQYIITNKEAVRPSPQERMLGAIRGLASSYGDPYTVYFPPKEAKAFAETISGSFAGVGMEIGSKEGILTVIAPLKGTPAEKAGIKAGDRILTIDSKSTEDISVEKAVSQIRGPAGTTVELTLIRAGKLVKVKIVRDIINVPKTEDSLDKKSGVYHIALYEFTVNSADLFNKALARFKNSGSKKLVIDLRGNPGGYLESAVDIASHFLPKGATVVTEDFGDKKRNNVHTSLGYNDIPARTKIVVLLDGGSASASEILASALQDAKVATVIGTKSFGKGSVQNLVDLGEGSLKITIARWVTPAGKWIMANGITPDIIVPYTPEDATAKRDPQMLRAVQFLTKGK